MILFALILVVLLGFAAVAIDGAAAWAQRRQNQSGADTGALAGGILIGDKPTGLALADATDEVIRPLGAVIWMLGQTGENDVVERRWDLELRTL